MSEHVPQILIVEPRRRGRPRASEPGSAVMTWLPQSDHDRLVKLAQIRGETVSSVVRSLLMTKQRSKIGE